MDHKVVFYNSENHLKLRKTQLYQISEKVTSFFWDPSPDRPDFEAREGQQDMACEIMDALISSKHILVEAGVGIGKSYAYLVPLLLYSAQMCEPVVVATSTIALQEQLLGDVKYLQEQLGMRQEVVLAKGQTHYLCRKKAEEYLLDPGAELAGALRSLIDQGCQDRADFPSDFPYAVWEKICISRFSRRACTACPYSCLYRQIRSKLMCTNGIVLCNQDFLTAHLLQLERGQQGLINSCVELAVIDEAHNLEGKVRTATTGRIGQNGLLGLLHSAQSEVKTNLRSMVQGDLVKAQQTVREFFRLLQAQVARQISISVHDMKYADRFFFEADNKSLALLHQMSKDITTLSEGIQLFSSMDSRRGSEFSAADDLDAKAVALRRLVDDLDNNLLWIEGQGNRTELVYCPKDTREIISNLYFCGDIQTVLTSATLTEAVQDSLEGAYSYFVRSTGFPFDENGVLADPKPSPFPYDDHAMIYYCDDLPHPTEEHDAFIQQGVERLIEILDISQGKALVLFTAKADLDEVYTALQNKRLPYRILIQQSGASQDQVLREFREDENSVLLGAGAYWEGIDIKGKSLSNLVIFRLPFPVPDPIIEYKASLSKNPLMEVRVPEMIIKLKQGIGRLIRGFTDTGIVSIIDPRLRDNPAKPYHNITWASLPIHNRTNSIQKLREFYCSLNENRDNCSIM